VSTLYAATGDAVARVTLRGGDEAEVALALEGSGACTVAVDPQVPERVYAGTFDDGIRVSEDGGATWRTPDAGPADGRVLALAVSRTAPVAYAGTEPSNLYRTEDAGRTWELLPALRALPSEPRWSFPGRPWTHHVRTIALHPADPDVLLVGVELGGVMRSTDAGASWADHNPQAPRDVHAMLTHPLAPDRVYEAAGDGVARSEDAGASWAHVEAGLDRGYAWATAVDPQNPDLWYVAVSSGPFAAHGGGDGEARLMRTTDGAWEPAGGWGDDADLRRMPYALATLPDRPGAVVAGLRGGVLLLSEDAGASWTRLRPRLPDVVALAAAP
jgi:photosystem II stability/assembly factor-like uncharacterized protein